MKEWKSFQITQNEVLNAYKAVKANKGAGGVDRVDFETFEKNWKNRLYTLWNRMSSGTYFPKPVRGVEIQKKNGKVRLLGIPTIEDRVAQMVLRNRLPYNRLTEEEKQSLIRIGSKSDFMKSHIPQRGKKRKWKAEHI